MPETEAPQEAAPFETPFELEILIGEDGEVIFPDLPREMLEVALQLNPDDQTLLCRLPETTDK